MEPSARIERALPQYQRGALPLDDDGERAGGIEPNLIFRLEDGCVSSTLRARGSEGSIRTSIVRFQRPTSDRLEDLGSNYFDTYMVGSVGVEPTSLRFQRSATPPSANFPY